MKKIAFFGGSIPSGGGFKDSNGTLQPNNYESPYIYPNLIKKSGYDIVNCALTGSGNLEIFRNACNFIANNTVDIIFVEWNDFYRFRFYPVYDFVLDVNPMGVQLNEQIESCLPLSKKDYTILHKSLMLLYSDYKSVIDLLDYARVLEDYCANKKIQLAMVNGSTPWTKQSFIDPDTIDDIGRTLDSFTKELLDFENKSDQEILQRLGKIYKKYTSLNLSNWVEMFESYISTKVDVADDGLHPGPESHKIYATDILNHLGRTQ